GAHPALPSFPTRRSSDLAAKAIGGDVHVLVAGKDCKAAAEAASKLDGVKKVLLADAAPYEHQLAEPVAALIVSLAGSYDAIVARSEEHTSELQSLTNLVC